MDHDLIHNEADVDDLISDIHHLIDETPDEAPEPAAAEPETAEAEPVEELPQEEPAAEPAPTEEPVPEEPFQQKRWTERQKVPKHVAKLQQNQEEAYARWLKEQEEKGDVPPPVFEEELPKKKKKREKSAPAEDVPEAAEDVLVAVKKKRRAAPWLCLMLVLLTLAAAVLTALILPQQPMARSEHIHAAGTSTVLLAGTDTSCGRTEMLMLMSINTAKGRLSLVSIPGDALIPDGEGAVKLKAVYALEGGGHAGIAALEQAVERCVGFVPDGTLVLHPEALQAFVDILNEVSYEGRALTGEEAWMLLTAQEEEEPLDLARVQTQRAFLAELIGQCRSFSAAVKAPLLLDAICENAVTDMTTQNLLWLARAALVIDPDRAETVTLPGSVLEDGNYLLDAEMAVQTVNAYCNPYIRAVADGDLDVFTIDE